MKTYQTNTIEIDGIHLVYHTSGDKTKPTLLFLHAWGIGIEWLPPVMHALSKHFSIIAPEHPGLLRSGTPADNSFESYATFYRTFLHALSISTPLLVVGSSFGGGIASMLTKLYPELVQKLILIDSVLPSEFSQTFFVSSITAVNTVALRSRLVPLFVKKCVIWRTLGTPLVQLTPSEMQKKIAFISTPRYLNVDYSNIHVPTAFIWGTNDRYTHPIRYARAIVKANPQIQLYEYPGSVPTLYKHPERIVPLLIKATS